MTLAVIDPRPEGVNSPRPLAIIVNGPDNADARRSAEAAETARRDAEDFAASAQTSARYYSTRAAGAAATATDQLFVSDELGRLSIFKRIGAAPNYEYLTDVPSSLGFSMPGGGGAVAVDLEQHHQAGDYVKQRVWVHGAGTGLVYQVMFASDAVGETPNTEGLSLDYGAVLKTSKHIWASGHFTDYDIGQPNYRRVYNPASPWGTMFVGYADTPCAFDAKANTADTEDVLYRGNSYDGRLRIVIRQNGGLRFGNVAHADFPLGGDWPDAFAAMDLDLVPYGATGLLLAAVDPGTDGAGHLVLESNGYISALDGGSVERVLLQYEGGSVLRLGRTNQGGHTLLQAGTGNYVYLDSNFFKPMSVTAATLTSGDTTAGLMAICSDDPVGAVIAHGDGSRFRRAFDRAEVGTAIKGTTAQRPANPAAGQGPYFDTTLAAAGKPIWYTGTAWVDATGTTV